MVNGSSVVGGLVAENSGTIKLCYALGAVLGNSYVGGLVGRTGPGSTINSCYSTGAVTGAQFVGGLVGASLSSVTECYWDTVTSGQSTSDGGEGRTTDEMTYRHAKNTYVGWDFVAVWVADTNYKVNKGYPHLLVLLPDSADERKPRCGIWRGCS